MSTASPVPQLSPEETATLAALLGKLDPNKPFGSTIFNAIAGVSKSITIQPIWIRDVDGQLQVWLRLRGPNEVYPGEYSAPSGVMFPAESEQQTMERLIARFYGGKLVKQTFVESKWIADVRGPILHIVYLVEFDGDKGLVGDWFPMDALPKNTVSHHVEMIQAAAEHH